MQGSLIPNTLTLLRIALTVPICFALVRGDYLLALGLAAVAGTTDGLDGLLAKRFGWESRFGRLMDPLADKIMLVSVMITLWWIGLVPWWAMAAVALRDLIIVIGALGIGMFFSHVDARPTAISKINTCLQIAVVLLVIVDVAKYALPLEFMSSMFVALAVSAFLSGADYVWMGAAALFKREDPLEGMDD